MGLLHAVAQAQVYPYTPQTAAYSFAANPTSNAGLQSSVNALQGANMMGAVILADASATSNITLSGVQTIDGFVGYSGAVILANGQSTAANNGLWVMNSGAWTRPINFPTGYVIPQFCTLSIFITNGTLQGGKHFKLLTNSASITIGTTAQTYNIISYPLATTSANGIVNITTSGNVKVASMALSPTAAGGSANDCVAFADVNGGIGDEGVQQTFFGPCILGDSHGHPQFYNQSLVAPTASVGSIDANANDARGRVTGLSAATSITITFNASWPYAPSCGASDSAGSVVGVSSVTAAAVTFSVTALTGSLNYWCF